MTQIDLAVYLRIVWKWLWLILIIVALAAVVSHIVSGSMPRVFRTSTILMVGEDISNPNIRQEDLILSQRALNAYMNLARREPVLAATVDALALPISWRTLQQRIVVVRVEGANLFEIRLTDTDPQRAQMTANEIARQLIKQSATDESRQQTEERRQFVQRQLDVIQANIERAEAELAGKQAQLGAEVSARGVLDRQDEIQALEAKITSWRSTFASLLPVVSVSRGPNILTIIDAAYLPNEPTSPDMVANVLMAAAVGLLLALGTVFVIEHFSNTLDTTEKVRSAVGLSVLVSVPSGRRLKRSSRAVVVLSEPHSPIAEAYRVLRTAIQQADIDQTPLTLMVTSPGWGEGKSFTSANLAASFALNGQRTILVDADLRQPSLHEYFGYANREGLTSLLGDQETPAPAIRLLGGEVGGLDEAEERLNRLLLPTPLPGLRVLTSGPIPSNPAELLGSPAMQDVMRRLARTADIVILDSPPVLPVADSVILAARATATLLVVQAGRTSVRSAQLAHEALARAQARPLGIVLNRATESLRGYYRSATRGEIVTWTRPSTIESQARRD